MSGYKEKGKEIFKNGWHPEKPGTTLKGQIKGLVGRGDNNEKSNHVARPLAALKDPASFGPPPKRQIATPPPLPATTAEYSPQEPEEPKSPPKPYQVDTTGLTTSHLPALPVRRDGSNVLPPPSQAAPRSGAPPSLPPRLPPRSSNGRGSPAPIPSPRPLIPARTATPESQRPSSSTGQTSNLLNQGAINRLGAAGISVPGLGIGGVGGSGGSNSGRPSPPPPPRPSSASSQSNSQPQSSSQMSELQSRFSRLGRSDSTSQPANTPESAAKIPSTGTTWAQKQQALKTASTFRQDPSSVSLSDAKSAASTFNNFRQRHGDQVAAGARTANGLHEKYGSQYGSLTRTTTPSGDNGQRNPSPVSGLSSVAGSLVSKKAPPPPPPPKKRGLSLVGGSGGGGTGDSGAPPPVPLSTRPQF